MSNRWNRLLAMGSLVILVSASAGGCRASERTEAVAEPARDELAKMVADRVREPAVAGLFYPGDEAALSQAIDRLLEAAAAPPIVNLKALICPHAGYIYSGPTAACGYRTLVGRPFDTAIVLAPSHYAAFAGASVCAAEAYRTPLGLVKIARKARELAERKPFVLEHRCLVRRPAWWRESPTPAPPSGQDTPHTWEHAAEVQIPFLQKVLKDFSLIPVVMGEVDPEQAAKVLADQLDEKTVIVASSDLSHYHPYDQASALDKRCVKAVCDLDVEEMKSQEACGKTPILTVMHLARLKGWQAQLLDYRNSGDTAGDKSAVVGYAAIAFYAPAKETFDQSERKQLLELARKTVAEVVRNGNLPEAETSPVPMKFAEPKGCFVTLTKHGELRGCMGHVFAREPLLQAIRDNARNAAVRDPRFAPVKPEELDELEIELSILTEPRPLSFSSPEDLLAKLEPLRDGVVLKIGERGATYLPQVWAQIPDKEAFLDSLARKAGCPPSAWRNAGTSVLVYRVESFKESEL